MAISVQVAGDKVVGTGVHGATGPGLSGEGMDEDGVLEDGCAAQPGATSQAPRPLVSDPSGSSTATTTEEELCTWEKCALASLDCRGPMVGGEQ